jgi:DNA-binding response OmpR family regulator
VLSVLVLIVDDQADSRWLLSEFFRLNGFRAATAANGAEAIEVALAEPPDVILLDLQMPLMSGEAFREHQLREPRIASVPVLCLSGRHDAGERARRVGLSCFIKPVPLDVLLAEVQRLTRSHA